MQPLGVQAFADPASGMIPDEEADMAEVERAAAFIPAASGAPAIRSTSPRCAGPTHSAIGVATAAKAAAKQKPANVRQVRASSLGIMRAPTFQRDPDGGESTPRRVAIVVAHRQVAEPRAVEDPKSASTAPAGNSSAAIVLPMNSRGVPRRDGTIGAVAVAGAA